MSEHNGLTCKELAALICAHLKRFEVDEKINRRKDGHARFYQTGAAASGRFVRVTYIGYQGSTVLTKDEAARYLSALDAGFVGRHYEALQE